MPDTLSREATDLIDDCLELWNKRNLVAVSELTDLLLDIRFLINKKEDQS